MIISNMLKSEHSLDSAKTKIELYRFYNGPVKIVKGAQQGNKSSHYRYRFIVNTTAVQVSFLKQLSKQTSVFIFRKWKSFAS